MHLLALMAHRFRKTYLAVLAVAPGRSLAGAFLPAETLAAVAVTLIYVASRNLFAAMAGGVLVVFAMRMWLGA
jgi:hypothetical protein